jgi:hypothetical protein
MSVVINRSEAVTLGGQRRIQPSPLKQEQRKYDDGPLPIKASDHAPLKARIVNRVFEGGVVTFELKIGDTVMNGIGLEEVLDYVSPYHLEEYENQAFKEEEEMLRIADEEDQRLREEERERRKQRAKNKGVAVMEDTSMSDNSQDATEYDAATGRNGRPRPSYKKDLLKVRQRRRRRKRDKVTGELLPRSDDEELIPRRIKQEDQEDQDSSSDDRSDRKRNPFSMDNLPIRRRRRKRDPITKELLPLDLTDGHQSTPKNEPQPKDAGSGSALQAMATAFFEKPKRPRRKRHPVTNELMPLGWHYDPEAEKRQREAGIKVPSIQRLNLSKENEPKRRRLERNMSSSGGSGTPHKPPTHDVKAPTQAAPTKAVLMAFKQGDVIDVDSDSAEDEIQVTPAEPKPKLLRRGVGGAAVNQKTVKPASNDGRSDPAVPPVHASQKKPAQSREPSSGSNSSIIPLQVDDGDSSSEEEEEEDEDEDEEEEIAAPRTGSSKVDIPNRSAAAKEPSSAAESDDDELPEDEYVVQAILAHAPSKPIEHPSHVGKKAVMLYKVKWEGWETPTWEPLSSFDGAMDLVRAYQEKVKMKESDRNA